MGESNTGPKVVCDIADDLAISDEEIDLLIASLFDLVSEIANE